MLDLNGVRPDWTQCRARLYTVQRQSVYCAMQDWRWCKARLDKVQARLDMVKSQTGYGTRPDWNSARPGWTRYKARLDRYKARLDMLQGQTGTV